MHKQEIIFLGEQMSYDRSPEFLFGLLSVRRGLKLQVSNREAETCDLPQSV